MRSFGVLVCLMLACVVPYSHGLMAQDLKVLVLDALNGKPQANVKVEYFCTGAQRNTAQKMVLTNNQGLAMFSNPCSYEADIEISVYPPNKKEQCGVGPITLKEILSAGAVAKPDAAGGLWCPTKVSRTIKPIAGQVVMFVKRPTWLQSHFPG